jgi:hypothetical protein
MLHRAWSETKPLSFDGSTKCGTKVAGRQSRNSSPHRVFFTTAPTPITARKNSVDSLTSCVRNSQSFRFGQSFQSRKVTSPACIGLPIVSTRHPARQYVSPELPSCASARGNSLKPGRTGTPQDLRPNLKEKARRPEIRVDANGSGSLHAANVCSYGGEFFLDALVAAVDVVHAVDDGFALGDERGQDE